jgi:glutamine cyclotransferase
LTRPANGASFARDVTLRLLPATLAALASVCDGCAPVPEPSAALSPSPPAAPEARPPPTTWVPSVVAQRPHDPRAFTQGLLFANGAFLESAGGYGESSLRRVEPDTGRVLASVALPPKVFGEGLARLHGELFQLTWLEHVCFVYDEATLEKRRELALDGEGWGLTTDGDKLLVMSDGSSTLRFLDPASLRTVRTLAVREGTRAVDQLNELEWVRGEIFANIWHTRLVARIDPRSGDIVGYLDLAGLPEPHHDDLEAVLNGIAYDETRDRLFVTGKLWGSTFEITRPKPLVAP